MIVLLPTGNLFFFILPFLFLSSKYSLFSYQNKKENEKINFAAARLPTISATRCTGNKLVFEGWPNVSLSQRLS